MKGEKLPKNVGDSHIQQINVLRAMYSEGSEATPRPLQINEIAQLSGLRDEKETQRYLFILEGQKLVTPFPEGDFTSRTWHITKYGAKAVRTINRATVIQ